MMYAQGIEIIFVIDNNPCDDRLKRQWGLSCLVRGTEKTILFDTGPSGSALLHNMEKLGIEPAEVGVVVISHKHQDHTGGLDAFLKANGAVTVYLLESFPPSLSRRIHSLGAEAIPVRGPTKICGHVFTTGEVASVPEQALVIQTDRGGILITGCAHPGILHVLERAKEMTQGKILMALGGFHLGGEGVERLQQIVQAFREAGVGYVGPCHCSGDLARKLFQKTYREHYLDLGVGKIIRIQDLP